MESRTAAIAKREARIRAEASPDEARTAFSYLALVLLSRASEDDLYELSEDWSAPGMVGVCVRSFAREQLTIREASR